MANRQKGKGKGQKAEEPVEDSTAKLVGEGGDLSNPDVTTKYRAGGDIVNLALKAVCDAAKEGAQIVDLCEIGDNVMNTEVGKLFNKKGKDGTTIEKGISFPTCISVNHVCGHFSPLKSDNVAPLQKGDMVKVDLGVHFDGYLAQGAHTVVVGDEKITGRKADVLRAAWTAAEAACRAAQEGASNKTISGIIQRSAAAFKCEPLHGVLSHQIKRYTVDGTKVILNHEGAGEEQVQPITVEVNEAYCMDLVVSTGQGVARDSGAKATVYKRAKEANYTLKTQKARQFISEVNHRFPRMPFSLRVFEDEQMSRIGVSEAKRHDLLMEYPVLSEKDGEYVAQFKYTLLILPTGPKKITGLPFDQDKLTESENVLEDEEIKKVLAVSMNPKKKKAEAKAKAMASPESGDAENEEENDEDGDGPKPKPKAKGKAKGAESPQFNKKAHEDTPDNPKARDHKKMGGTGGRGGAQQ